MGKRRKGRDGGNDRWAADNDHQAGAVQSGEHDDVAGIAGEISNASQEQALGVQEINSSITSMDEMTQQNSALVEESTAAARALSEQASQLGELMVFFKITDASTSNWHTATPQRRSSREPSADKPRPLVTAGDDGWNEF